MLVAEDNRRNQILIRQQLALWGIDVGICEDGEIAYEATQRQTFRVLITDLHMPNLTGYDLMKRIRADEVAGTARTYIVALSADASEEERHRCLDGGMDEYLTKPLDLETLRSALERMKESCNGD